MYISMASGLLLFRSRLLYQRAGTAAQFEADMARIAALDKRSERLSLRYGKIYGYGCMWAFFSFFFAIFCLFIFANFLSGQSLSTALTVVFAVPMLLVLAALPASVLAGYYARTNVADIRYGLLAPLAKMLERDMAEGAKVDVRVDFSSPTLPKKQTAKGPYLKRRGWKQYRYEDPWFWLSGSFLDNTEFALSVKELTVVRSGTKRGRSGKLKRKTKTKPRGLVMKLLLRFSRKKYGAIALLQNDLAQAVIMPSGIHLQKVKASDHQLLIQVKVPAHSRLPHDGRGLYELFARMLLSAYQVLNLSKSLSKAA